MVGCCRLAVLAPLAQHSGSVPRARGGSFLSRPERPRLVAGQAGKGQSGCRAHTSKARSPRVATCLVLLLATCLVLLLATCYLPCCYLPCCYLLLATCPFPSCCYLPTDWPRLPQAWIQALLTLDLGHLGNCVVTWVTLATVWLPGSPWQLCGYLGHLGNCVVSPAGCTPLLTRQWPQ